MDILRNYNASFKTFAFNNIVRLIEEFQNNKRDQIWILYLGDLDPSGWAMDQKIKGLLRKHLGTRVTFKRVGVTENQLDTYNLRHLTNPEPKIIKKFSNPKNRFVKPLIREFGSAFQIELEVLDALPDFENIVRAEVNSLYDSNVYEDVLSRPEHSRH